MAPKARLPSPWPRGHGGRVAQDLAHRVPVESHPRAPDQVGCIHHRDGGLPPSQRGVQHLRHEHGGHPRHGAGAVGVLGRGHTGYHLRNIPRAAVHWGAGKFGRVGSREEEQSGGLRGGAIREAGG